MSFAANSIFPWLKHSVRQLADHHRAEDVLVDDKASGTSLIQELRADGFSKVQAAPAIEGDKIMRLHARTAKIEGGFLLFLKEAAWLDTYICEFVSFPNAKNDGTASTIPSAERALSRVAKMFLATPKSSASRSTNSRRVRFPAWSLP